MDADAAWAAEKAVVIPAPAVDNPKVSASPQTAVIAAGCFWGVQGVYQHVRGVQRALSGYSGGTKATADYEAVSRGSTGHAESVFENGNGGFQVTSDVEVWKTVKQAEQHMGALMKPALPRCIRYSLLKSVGNAANVTLLPTKTRKLGKFAEVSMSYRVPVAIKSGSKTFGSLIRPPARVPDCGSTY